MEAMTHLDDVTAKDGPIDADAILTDEALGRGGLVKIEAFVRTRTSAAAARKAKQREAQADSGLKQANIIAPVEMLESLKAIAKACSGGLSLEKAIISAVPSVTSHDLVTKQPEIITVEIEKIDPEQKRLAAIGQKVEALKGWKRTVANWLGLVN